MGMVAVSGSLQPGEVSEGTGRVQQRAYVELRVLNSAIDEALHDRKA